VGTIRAFFAKGDFVGAEGTLPMATDGVLCSLKQLTSVDTATLNFA
jgi:hypothetical protein